MWRGVVGVIVAVWLAAPTGDATARKKPLPDACPGGRFPVAGDALVPGGATPDAVLIDGTQVSVASGCAPVTARQKRTRSGTRLVARWKTCGTLVGPVRLVVKLDAATCESLVGTFKGRKVRRKLSAQVETPANVFGRTTDPLPDGAVSVTQDEWNQATQRPDFRSIDPAQVAADRAVEDQAAADDAQTVTTYVNANPGLAPQLLGGVDPNDTAVMPGDDGEYLHTLTDGSGSTLTVSTLGRRGRFRFLAPSLTGFPTFQNQLALYTEYYDGLANIDPALAGQYPSPAQASTFGLVDLVGYNVSLATSFNQYVPLVPPPGGFAPPGYPASCAAEEGSGDRTDQGSLCPHTAKGVWSNSTWGLKWFATCAKQQGARGTCWGFGTVAATELWVAKKYHRWINLSEQQLVFQTKHIWYPSFFGDNGGPPLDKILDTGYTFPFENQWAYNPSYGRTIDNAAMTYHDSCVHYGGAQAGYCSNTNHQGKVICFDFGLFRLCGAIGPDIATTSGFAPTSYTWFWDPSNPDNSFATLVWALAIFQKPVIVAFPVTPSFDGPDANGYMTYRGPHCPVDGMGNCTPSSGCECDRGGHITIVTGLIDNTQLPAGVPPGDGGGYVIMKNSWGSCYADGGWVYVPYTWFKQMVGAAAVIGDIN